MKKHHYRLALGSIALVTELVRLANKLVVLLSMTSYYDIADENQVGFEI